MFEIKKTTVTREAVMATENARYNISYNVESELLKRVDVAVFVSQPVEAVDADGKPVKQMHEFEVGHLMLEDSVFKTYNFPYSEKLPVYMEDFTRIINEIINPTKGE